MVLAPALQRKPLFIRVLHRRPCLLDYRVTHSMQSRPDWAWEFCRGEMLLLERELAGPFLRVPIEAGNILGIELETCAEGGGRFPFSAFMGEHQLKDRAQATGLAEQNGLGGM